MDRLSIGDRSGNGVTLGSKSSVALDEEDDTFDEAPDAATDDGDVGEEHDEAEEEGEERNFGGEGSHDGSEEGEDETAAGEGEVDDAALFVTEIPVVGAEAAEEDAEQTGSDRRFDAGRNGVLRSGVRGGWVGVWVHKDLLDVE